MYYSELKEYIDNDKIADTLKKIKVSKDISQEKIRYKNLLAQACERFGDGDYHFISSPGRTEICGNHTDHQGGHVVAAALDIDNLCVVKKNADNKCIFVDKRFPDVFVDLNNLEIVEEEKNTSTSLIRGIANRLNELGYQIGGFEAICDSQVLIGSGISSSACYEVMLVEIFNCLYNDLKISPIDKALISQYAENVYFGKPCGLMDQLAIAVGGFVTIDFGKPDKPKVESYDFNFSNYDYSLLLINTKGDHSDLTYEYGAVPKEIKEVAKKMDVDILSQKDSKYFFDNLKDIREEINNDRAVLRAFHYYNEDKRAAQIVSYIANKDIDNILKIMNESGKSSFMYLQNVYPSSMPNKQPCSIALALSDYVLNSKGASRIHGGGFAGTIQAVVPNELLTSYKKIMTNMFGEDCLLEIRIRPFGTKTII